MLTTEIALTELVEHREWVPASQTLEDVFRRFSEHSHEFMAVIDGEHCLGICSRETVSVILGTLYGRACFAREPVFKHMQAGSLRIMTGQSLPDILKLVSSRSVECFYEDVLLTDRHGRLQGLITTRRLIQLQQETLQSYIDTLEAANLELEGQNRQMANELMLARELQLSILPRCFPELLNSVPAGAKTGIDFQHRYQPSGSVGGDFFQLFSLGRDQVGIFLCDVMGHGVAAALVTAMIRVALDGLQQDAGEPARLMTRLNAKLSQMLDGSDLGLFATALYLIVDGARNELVFASAGHPPGLHLKQRKTVHSLLHPHDESGPPIGIMPEADYVDLVYALPRQPGDCLLLFTDGLYEVFDPDQRQLGYEGLQAIILEQATLPLGQLLDGTLEAVRRFAHGIGLNDDVCLLGLQWR